MKTKALSAVLLTLVIATSFAQSGDKQSPKDEAARLVMKEKEAKAKTDAHKAARSFDITGGTFMEAKAFPDIREGSIISFYVKRDSFKPEKDKKMYALLVSSDKKVLEVVPVDPDAGRPAQSESMSKSSDKPTKSSSDDADSPENKLTEILSLVRDGGDMMKTLTDIEVSVAAMGRSKDSSSVETHRFEAIGSIKKLQENLGKAALTTDDSKKAALAVKSILDNVLSFEMKVEEEDSAETEVKNVPNNRHDEDPVDVAPKGSPESQQQNDPGTLVSFDPPLGGKWPGDMRVYFVQAAEAPKDAPDAGPGFPIHIERPGSALQLTFGVGFFGSLNMPADQATTQAVDPLGNPLTLGGKPLYQISTSTQRSDFSNGLSGFAGFTYLLPEHLQLFPDWYGMGRGGVMAAYDFTNTPNRVFFGVVQYLTRDEKMSFFVGTQSLKVKRFTGTKVGDLLLNPVEHDRWSPLFRSWVFGITVPLDTGGK